MTLLIEDDNHYQLRVVNKIGVTSRDMQAPIYINSGKQYLYNTASFVLIKYGAVPSKLEQNIEEGRPIDQGSDRFRLICIGLCAIEGGV